MQQLHQNTLDALRRVRGCLERQFAALGSLVSPDTRAELEADTAQLEVSQVEQVQAAGVSKAETANQALYRKDFYFRFMRPIRRIAKAKLATAPELPVLVAKSTGVTKGDFVAAAEALAAAATKYEKEFVGKGMSADFVAQMNAAVTQLKASRDSQGQAAVLSEAATKSITEAEKNARDLIVVLDSVITPAVRHNAQLLADWKASSRIVTSTALPPQPTGLAVPGSAPAPVAPEDQTAKSAA